MTKLDLARLQFAMTSIYHFLFVPVTIGLSFLVAMLQTAWYRHGNEAHLRLTRFFGTLLVSTIAVARSAASGYPGRMPMAREMTSRPITSDVAASIIIVSLAQVLTGKVSVGLNAVALVNARYR